MLCVKTPVCMGKWRIVKSLSQHLPVRQTFVHQADKAITVMACEQERHLMHDDVFKKFRRLFGQIGIETDAACTGVAASPFGFHPPCTKKRSTFTSITGSHLAIN